MRKSGLGRPENYNFSDVRYTRHEAGPCSSCRNHALNFGHGHSKSEIFFFEQNNFKNTSSTDTK